MKRTVSIALLVFAFAAGLPVFAPAQAQPVQAEQPRVLVLTRLAQLHFQLDAGYGSSYGSLQQQSASRRIAEGIARRSGLRISDDWPLPLLGLNCFVMEVPPEIAIADAIRNLSSDRDVAFAEPMETYRTQGGQVTYNDPLYPAQNYADAWPLGALHQVSTGRGVRVAVIDSGIDDRHPDLAGQVILNRNFVAGQAFAPENHGTAVAGVIAARANNHQGIVGLASDARIVGLRACVQTSGSAAARCDSLSLAKALHFAIGQKAQVINLSLSGPRSELLARLIQLALDVGVPVVAAFDEHAPDGGFPASLRGVVAVADEALARPPAWVYTAPGKDVLTTLPGARWNLVHGSSFAAAHVSGLIALWLSRHSAHFSASGLASVRPDGGAIDACATLLQSRRGCDCAC